MATVLRTWSYQYPWLYDGITKLTALSVGGEYRLRRLALQSIDFKPEMTVLDLCCGNGPVTEVLVQLSEHVTGLDASPKAIARAKHNVPEATFVEAFAEAMPFTDARFDLVHISMALHEMETELCDRILNEVYRVLKPGGIFTLIDFHRPSNPIFWPGLAMFLWLFETDTAWQLIQSDLGDRLAQVGFAIERSFYRVGGSLQVIQGRKTIDIR
jgi:ubiquinone/menaquinone biosynthesis C-methylase UbiE